ncbi:MAG: hypothetical protein U0136_21885 [Bdellovibrionota bacterium]
MFHRHLHFLLLFCLAFTPNTEAQIPSFPGQPKPLPSPTITTPEPPAPSATPIPDVYCCACAYNGKVNCSGLSQAQCGAEGDDCYPADGQCHNRFKHNCDNFQFDAKLCNKTFTYDYTKSQPSLADLLSSNKCTFFNEWTYGHGNPRMCKGFVDHLQYCFQVEDGMTVTVLNCSVFQNPAEVQAQLTALAEMMAARCYTGTVTISAAPHDEQVAVPGDGVPLCANTPSGSGDVFNARYSVTVTSRGCSFNYPSCSNVQTCTAAQVGQYAYCLDPGSTQPRAKYCRQFIYPNGSVYLWQ